jgi:D-psicose/D-tagatose/L-ribulose 3-epimerase
MIAPSADRIGIGVVETMASLGFDYIELSLADVMDLPQEAFQQLALRLERSGIPCDTCNNFFPSHIRLTGEAADPAIAMEYARPALARAARLGARVIVFGSSGAKNVPAGFAHEAAWRQLVALLKQLGPVAAGHDIVIAIEPINRQESNIVTLAAEGLRLAADVDHPNIQLLIDFYHLMMEREDPDVILRAGSAIRHLHVAEVEGRRFPRAIGSAVSGCFDRVRRIGYTGRCSIEAVTDDFPADAGHALHILRQETAWPPAPPSHSSTGAHL